jgi:hypothetical protein
MNGYLNGVQAVGTVTVSASGSVDIYPARSNAPFKDLSISIVPIETISPYDVTVYNNGEELEAHSYPDEDNKMICYMSYPHLIFPANIGTETITKFFDPDKLNFPGISIGVTIRSRSSTTLVFLVYATYMECVGPRFLVINQET